MDLESKNSQLTEELSTSRLNPASMRNSIDWVPRGAARHTLTGHRATINCVAFHPLYNTCASASEDSSIKIWDWETGEFERTLKGHTKAVQDCDYDTKGQWLVSCSSDLSIKLWDVPNDYSASKTFHGHDHSISSVRFLPDDERFASASRDQSIRIWEVATGCVQTSYHKAVRLMIISSQALCQDALWAYRMGASSHAVTGLAVLAQLFERSGETDRVGLPHILTEVPAVCTSLGFGNRRDEVAASWTRQRGRMRCLCTCYLYCSDTGASRPGTLGKLMPVI